MTSPKPVLIAMNAFKGTLSHWEACDAVAAGLQSVDIPYTKLPVADGGLGTLATVHTALGGDLETFETTGPLGKKTTAQVLCMPNKTKPTSLFVESAQACGHQLVAPEERDALRATSHGLGEVLSKAIQLWTNSIERVYVGLGDSAISDAGMGMLGALGFQFLDEMGRPLWGSAMGLRQIKSVRPPATRALDRIRFVVLCDVVNPLCGPRGSARVFSPQKGATPEHVKLIEGGMENFANVVKNTTGRKLGDAPMTGAAGGLAAGFQAFLNTELVHGARFLFDWIQFDRLLERHSLLVTGEGKTDSQTLEGKAPLEGIERAERLKKKVLLISGAMGEGAETLRHKPSVVGMLACGNFPNAREALYEATRKAFENPQLLSHMVDVEPNGSLEENL